MHLEEYRQRRDFAKTPEPSGTEPRSGSRSTFVIQKHKASRLHYDLRLEVDGVLKSWAIPRGPSLNPAEKRLAMETEDHPLNYAEFEGVIPEGEYGGGTVIVWDKGTYENRSARNGDIISMAEAYKEGEIKFHLTGKKLHGEYALIKTERGQKNEWLLIKKKDRYADARRKLVSHEPRSVLSGKDIKDVRQESAA